MTNSSLTYLTGSSNLDYSYHQHFHRAVINLDEVIREERLLKRIQKSKKRVSRVSYRNA